MSGSDIKAGGAYIEIGVKTAGVDAALKQCSDKLRSFGDSKGANKAFDVEAMSVPKSFTKPEFSAVGTFSGFAGAQLGASGVAGAQLSELQKLVDINSSIDRTLKDGGMGATAT